MKKVILIYIVLGIAIPKFFLSVQAQQPTQPQSERPLVQKELEATVTITDSNNKKLDVVRNTAIKRTENRIDALNTLLVKINNDTYLAETTKQEIKSEITTETQKLTTILNTIKSASTLDGVKNGFKGILDEKIYVFYIQKIRLLTIIDRLMVLDTRLDSLSQNLQTVINNYANEGKDVKDLQTAYQDMKQRITGIKTSLENSKTALQTTTPSNYKDIFTKTRKDLAKVRQDYAKIREDIATIRGEIKGIKNTTAGPTRTPSDTVTQPVTATVTPTSIPSSTMTP